MQNYRNTGSKSTVSVVILTKNSESTIRECLDSVAQNSPEEIVVVDGYSTDSTIDIVKEYTDKIYYDEGKGLCYARQLGAEMATEEYIFYVDSDIILPPNTLDTMLTEFRRNGYGAMTARALIRGGTGYIAWATRHYKNVVKPDSPGVRRATIPMKATLIPRELVVRHGFDLSTPSLDDISMSQRLIENNYNIAVSNTHVYHQYMPEGKHRGTFWVGVAISESFLKYRKSPTHLIRYTLLRGLGSPIQGLALSIARGDLRLIPYFVYVSIAMAAGFISGLFGAFTDALKEMTGIGKSK